jgi:hypothetical protein
VPNLPQGKELTLLIKLLKLTTSNNDSEALAAMRKANEQLPKLGGDWEKLLLGQVKVVADPFANLQAAPKPHVAETAKPKPAPQPQAQPTWAQQQATNTANGLPNTFAGRCYHCDSGVPVRHGIRWLCQSVGWKTFCNKQCYTDWDNGVIPVQRPQPRPQPAPRPAPNFMAQAAPPMSTRQARPNGFPGNCLDCNNFVQSQAGFITPKPTRGWDLYCTPCWAKINHSSINDID